MTPMPMTTPVLQRTCIMTEQRRKRIRLRAAAKRFDVQSTYLSRIAKPGGVLERDGITVIRDPDTPDVVMFYEDELFAWWKARHPEWTDEPPSDTPS